MIWSKILDAYPHPGSLSPARIKWSQLIAETRDPTVLGNRILESAQVCRQIHKLDPTGNTRHLPNLANFLDGGYREDRTGALKALRRENGQATLADGGPTLADLLRADKARPTQ